MAIMGNGQDTKKTILVLDDEPDVVAYLRSLFVDNNYLVLTASNGQDGMEKAKAQKPDLITLDISMPEKSGVRFYREIKEDSELKDIPVVIVTGVESTYDSGSGEDFKRFLGTRKNIPPPDGFVMKPIEEQELLGVVKKLVGD
jgi:CheY-like chemotaxis protein